MEGKFGPWRLEIDVEATKKLYREQDYALDSRENRTFAQNLTKEQRAFFDSMGVDPLRIRIQKKVFDIPEEDQAESAGKISSASVDFLVCGKFLAIPKDQMELYGDEELFGQEALKGLEITDTREELGIYDELGLGLGIRFKHPGFHCGEFGVDEKAWEMWDCGVILGSTLIFEEEA